MHTKNSYLECVISEQLVWKRGGDGGDTDLYVIDSAASGIQHEEGVVQVLLCTPSEEQEMMKWCLMSLDVSWHIRDKLWPMPKHGSI